MNGAMCLSQHKTFVATETNPLYVACCELVGVEVGSLGATWNDAPGRTKEEVLAVFDRIANS